MRLAIGFLSLTLLLTSCSPSEKQGAAFTLETGVSVKEVRACSNNPSATSPSAKKVQDGYLVTLVAHFTCDGDIEKVFLTQTIEKRATLVIASKQPKFGFGSSCECARVLTVKLSNRLEPGDTLYLLTDREVVGHLVLP